jgi:pimeloyl-ACP methyl ester carboxylesterase
MNDSFSTPDPEGPGSVSRAPNLQTGFADIFTSRIVEAGGLRQHVVIGGDGPPLLLVHGWPETWYAWRLLMPSLAEDFTVVAVDQRGMGLSGKPEDGYDNGTLAGDLIALMDALGHERFAVVGHDTGMVISYALAADNPDRVDRLVAAEIPGAPGAVPAPPLFVPGPLNNKLWHIPFNRAGRVAEQLVSGREDIFFGYEFAVQGGNPLPSEVIDYYVRGFTSPESLRGGFGFYLLPRLGRHHGSERRTREGAAGNAGPGGRRRGELGGTRRGRDAGYCGQRRDRSHRRRRPLGCRASSRGAARRSDRIPCAVQGCLESGSWQSVTA